MPIFLAFEKNLAYQSVLIYALGSGKWEKLFETLGNSEALGKMQKESEKGFTQLIEKLGLLDAQGGHKIIHSITLMNFHPLGRLLYIVVYLKCCVFYVISQN